MATKVEQLIQVLVAPFQTLANVAQQCLTERDVNSGIGAQLDVIGRIVGRKRAGVSDDEVYRRYLRAQIAANRSSGDPEDLINICHLVVNDPDLVVHVHTTYDASTIVELEGVAVLQSTADVARDMLRQAAAGGCRVVLQYALSVPANVFRLDSGPGLDVGRFAGAEE